MESWCQECLLKLNPGKCKVMHIGHRVQTGLSDMPSRRRLRSSLTDQLDVRQSQCSTVGDRAFAVAGARVGNSLPHDIVASDTLSHFRRGLKTVLFRQSYPSILF